MLVAGGGGAGAISQSVHLVRLLTSQVNTASSNRDLCVAAYSRYVYVYIRALGVTLSNLTLSALTMARSAKLTYHAAVTVWGINVIRKSLQFAIRKQTTAA